MAYLRLVDVGQATGITGEEYDAAIERAGKVFNVVKSMSLQPGGDAGVDEPVPRGHVTASPEPDPGAQRELLAVVASLTANDLLTTEIRSHHGDAPP